MLLSQIRDGRDRVRVVVREGTEAYAVNGAASVYDLALDAAVGNFNAMDVERLAAARKRARGGNGEPGGVD